MDTAVTWSVTGGSAGTSIDANGLLTVAADETAESLTVTAVSVANPAVSDSLELPIHLRGDLDKNGSVDIQDVMSLCRVIARQMAGQTPSDEEVFLGSLDGDTEIAITDVMEVCRILARNAI